MANVTNGAKPAKVAKSTAPAEAPKVPKGANGKIEPRPQKLKKIEIHGFKSIESASIELRELNVVIGANGAGKSNLIETFKLLERFFSGRLSEYVAGEPWRFLHHGQKKTSEISFGLTVEDGTWSIRLKHLRDKLTTRDDSVQSADDDQTQSTGDDQTQCDIGDTARKWVVYHFDDTSDQSPAKHLANLDDNRFLRHDADNIAAFLYWMQEKHPSRFRRLEEHVKLVAPFFERFVLAPSKLNENKIKLEWQHKGSEAYFDVFSLSDGTLRFICLAALLLQPEPPPLILLDEPELGLHPFAINSLADMLVAASKRTQVIVATQSVTLLSNFDPSDVIVAEHRGLKTTFKRLDEKELASWLEDFSLGELFEKNVLGGGP